MWVTLGELTRRSVRQVLPRAVYSLAARNYDRLCCCLNMSFKDYSSFVALLGRPAATPAVQIRFAGLKHPLWVRPGTPDAGETVHSVVREVYGKYLPSGPVRFIIDAGAYIGDTTAWYLSKYAGARVVALEPNPETFAALILNCAPYGQQARLIQAGIWCQDVWVRVIQNASPNGSSIAPCPPSVADGCPALNPTTILTQEGVDTIDIFKVDIEGAEEMLFSINSDPWLSRTRSIFIEIHSPQAYEAVRAATRRHGFDQRRYRELFIFSKRGL